MRLHALFSSLKWPIALLMLGGLLALAYAVNHLMQSERAAEANGEKVEAPRRAENGVVRLDAEWASSHGIKEEPAQAMDWYQRHPIYGRVVPNPQATAEVRSPFAGTLRADPETPWPVPGRMVRTGQVVALVDIRMGPQERLDLHAKLNDARLQQEGAEEVVKIQQERVARLQKAADGLSRKELDDALVTLADARTHRAKAKAAVALWEKALSAINQKRDAARNTWSEPLTAPLEGEVTELMGRPGMTIEAGGPVARVVDFSRPLLRLDFPPEALVAGPPPQVAVVAASFALVPMHQRTSASASPVLATLIGPAPQVDVVSQFAGYWYEVRPSLAEETTAPKANGSGRDGVTWRPGLFVKASIKVLQARPQAAVSVPRTALLFHQGRTLVFIRVAPGTFERRAVQVLGQEEGRWVLASGVAVGEPVVYCRAQVLLSEESRGDVDHD